MTKQNAIKTHGKPCVRCGETICYEGGGCVACAKALSHIRNTAKAGAPKKNPAVRHPKTSYKGAVREQLADAESYRWSAMQDWCTRHPYALPAERMAASARINQISLKL